MSLGGGFETIISKFTCLCMICFHANFTCIAPLIPQHGVSSGCG
jgi:hypothetical protein